MYNITTPPPEEKVNNGNPENDLNNDPRKKKEVEANEEIRQGGVLPQQRPPQYEKNIKVLTPPTEKIENGNPVNVSPATRKKKEVEPTGETRQGGVLPQQRPLQCENIKILTPPAVKIECENPMNDWKDVPPAPRIMKEDESHKEIRQGGVIPQQRPLQCENIKLLTPPKKKVESENPMNEWKDVLRAKKEDESLEEISQGGVLPQQRSPQRENTSILPPPLRRKLRL